MSFDRYRDYTQARIGLGNTGSGLPTQHWLLFAYHHALAVDAIKIPWCLNKQIETLHASGHQTEVIETKVQHREEYLLRPDLGRKLNAESRILLDELGTSENILLVASNGLSSLAMEKHLENFLNVLVTNLHAEGFKICHDRIMLAQNGRVGLIDDVGEIICPALGLVIIGERPGLSSPDSLAVYITYQPKIGRSDAERNCISNIRPPHGLSYEEASTKVIYLMKQAIHRKLSGVLLKDESGSDIKKRLP